jgi:hypothetical protein
MASGVRKKVEMELEKVKIKLLQKRMIIYARKSDVVWLGNTLNRMSEPLNKKQLSFEEPGASCTLSLGRYLRRNLTIQIKPPSLLIDSHRIKRVYNKIWLLLVGADVFSWEQVAKSLPAPLNEGDEYSVRRGVRAEACAACNWFGRVISWKWPKFTYKGNFPSQQYFLTHHAFGKLTLQNIHINFEWK